MFDTLAEKLGGVFDRLARRGALSEANVDEAMREIRVALLEADVALPVVKDFIAKVREQAVGQAVIKSVTPSQMVVKIVNDALVEMLGGENAALDLAAVPPVPVLMVGLQGSGKTTTSAKLALRLKKEKRKFCWRLWIFTVRRRRNSWRSSENRLTSILCPLLPAKSRKRSRSAP